MPFMTWEDNFSVGVPSIDEQHKKLIGLINRVFEGVKAEASGQVLGAVLDELVTYTQQHFSYEEALFAKTNYPESEGHKKVHDELKQKVLAIHAKFKAEKAGLLSLEVLNFLKDWLSKHILGTDKKYAPFLVAHGIK